MINRIIERNSIRDDEDREGNNAAFSCPLCNKVFIVSVTLHSGRRTCPKCGKSTTWVIGGKTSGGSAGIEWT
jgi:transcription elongation factor Elf1